jgi:hypothetical protein
LLRTPFEMSKSATGKEIVRYSKLHLTNSSQYAKIPW